MLFLVWPCSSGYNRRRSETLKAAALVYKRGLTSWLKQTSRKHSDFKIVGLRIPNRTVTEETLEPKVTLWKDHDSVQQ